MSRRRIGRQRFPDQRPSHRLTSLAPLDRQLWIFIARYHGEHGYGPDVDDMARALGKPIAVEYPDTMIFPRLHKLRNFGAIGWDGPDSWRSARPLADPHDYPPAP